MDSENHLKTIQEYEDLANQIIHSIDNFCKELHLEIHPMENFIPCNGLPNHIIPESSFQKHMGKCHGKQYDTLKSHRFFYQGKKSIESFHPHNSRDPHDSHLLKNDPSLKALTTVPDITNAVFEDEETEEIHTLIESSQESTKTDWDKLPLMQLYEIINNWKSIPKEFESPDMSKVSIKKIKGWLISQMDKMGVCDMELIDFFISLLQHPLFCQPDLLSAELYEFIGKKTRTLVLRLWKYITLEIFLLTRDGVAFEKEMKEKMYSLDFNENVVQKDSKEIPNKELISADDQKEKNEFDDLRKKRDYKRRRPSYRAKRVHITKRTYNQVLRDLIEREIQELRYTHGMTVLEDLESDPMEEEEEKSLNVDKFQEVIRYKDPLLVRDMDRKGEAPSFAHYFRQLENGSYEKTKGGSRYEERYRKTYHHHEKEGSKAINDGRRNNDRLLNDKTTMVSSRDKPTFHKHREDKKRSHSYRRSRSRDKKSSPHKKRSKHSSHSSNTTHDEKGDHHHRSSTSRDEKRSRRHSSSNRERRYRYQERSLSSSPRKQHYK